MSPSCRFNLTLQVHSARYGMYRPIFTIGTSESELKLAPGDVWRALRRGAHEVLNLNVAKTHRPLQDAEAAQLMYELLVTPDVRCCTASLARTIR